MNRLRISSYIDDIFLTNHTVSLVFLMPLNGSKNKHAFKNRKLCIV